MENQNSFTEVTTQGWGSRIMGSIKSVLTGIILFLVAFIILWWNEGRAVKTSKGLAEGASVVVRADVNSLDGANAGKLIHVSGKVNSDEVLKDDEFGLQVNALKLRRNVEMYQWIEETDTKEEKEIGGSKKTTTTYNYKKNWSSTLVNSEDFKVKEGHNNPAVFPYEEYTQQATSATVGAYALSPSLLSKVSNFQPYSADNIDIAKIRDAALFQENSGGTNFQKVYVGKGDRSNPQIGDVKVSFDIVSPGNDYSIIARQEGNTFEKFDTQAGTSIEMIAAGIFSPESMFESAQKSNRITTWILRLAGFLAMFFGLSLIFKPIVVLADVLPFLGNLLGMGLSLFSGIIAFALSFITIAIAWIFYRPILGISLLIVGIGVLVFFFARASKKKKLMAGKVAG